MKTWIKRTLYGLFGATLLVGGISACSHRHHDSGMAQWSAEDAAKWRERVIERAGKELQLDAAQKQRLGTLFDTMREQRNAFVGSTTNPRAELLALVSTEHALWRSALSSRLRSSRRMRTTSTVTFAKASSSSSCNPADANRGSRHDDRRTGWTLPRAIAWRC